MVEKRFGALRTIGTIFKVLGIISVAVGIAMAVIAVIFAATHSFANPLNSPMFGVRTMMGSGIWAGLVALLWGALGGLVLFGAGEIIFLLLAVEENTRATALMLRQQQEQTAPSTGRIQPPDPGTAA